MRLRRRRSPTIYVVMIAAAIIGAITLATLR